MKHVQDRIQAYLDGELSAAEAAAVREHCAQCAECDRAWRRGEAIWAALKTAGAPELRRSLWPQLQRRIRPARSPWLRLATAGGGVIAVMVGLFVGIWLGVPSAEQGRTGTVTSWLEESATMLESDQLTLDRLYLTAGAARNEASP